MQTKTVSFELKAINEQGVFEGYASVFDNVDLYGDIIKRGAFKKSLNDNKGDFPILWNHRDLIGKGLEAREDDRGLWVRGQLNLEVQQGREAYALAKQGAVKGLSIGFASVPGKMATDEKGVRTLSEIKLYEYSLTPFPANPEAQVISVKQETGDEEAIIALRGASRDVRGFLAGLIE